MQGLGRNWYCWIVLIGFLIISGKGLFGEALFTERFDYEDGELGSVSSNRWAPITSDSMNPNLDVIEGKLNWDFTGQVADPVNNGYYGATFSNSNISSGILFTYFDLEVIEAPIGTVNTAGLFLTLWNGSGGNRSRTFIAVVPDEEGGIIPDQFRLGITKQSGSRFDAVYYPETWLEGTKLTVVIRSDFDAETVRLYVNPTTEEDNHALATDGTFIGIKGVAVRHRDESEPGNNIGVFKVDNIAVTETFGDVDTPPDLPPDRLAVSGVPGDSISVNWQDNSNNETGFQIDRRTIGNGSFSSLGTVEKNRTHFLDSTAALGFEYGYRVTALGESDLVSSVSESVSAYIDPLPTSIPDISISGNAGEPLATFEGEANVSYQVEQSTDFDEWSISLGLQSQISGPLQFSLARDGETRVFSRVRVNRFSILESVGLTEPFKMPNNANGATLNLLDFGATAGNPSDDDAVALANAIATASIGDVLEIPSGEYHFKSEVTIPSGMSVVGAKDKATTIHTSGINNCLKIAPASTDITICDLVIVGEDDQLDHGIFVGEPGALAPERIWIKNIRIERFNRRAIQIRNAKHVKVETCTLLNALQLGGGGFGYK